MASRRAKTEKLYPDAFRGVLDESLDTLKMKKIFKRHKAELPFPYLEKQTVLPRRSQCFLCIRHQAV
ncbi:MAG: hypothetical protein L6V84_05995 [Oscillospiraceae bacterium]|nr:MAG: hypothetical protein L6V84_05995 [Oscillospiraceae bacterium]